MGDEVSATQADPVAVTFLEVRKRIEALRLVYPDRTDKMIALALFHRAETLTGREAHLLGLVATVLHFAAEHHGKSMAGSMAGTNREG